MRGDKCLCNARLLGQTQERNSRDPCATEGRQPPGNDHWPMRWNRLRDQPQKEANLQRQMQRPKQLAPVAAEGPLAQPMAPSPESVQLSADDALARLLEGNQRFLRGETRSAAFRREPLADLARPSDPTRPFSVVATLAYRPSGFSTRAWVSSLSCAW